MHRANNRFERDAPTAGFTAFFRALQAKRWRPAFHIPDRRLRVACTQWPPSASGNRNFTDRFQAMKSERWLSQPDPKPSLSRFNQDGRKRFVSCPSANPATHPYSASARKPEPVHRRPRPAWSWWDIPRCRSGGHRQLHEGGGCRRRRVEHGHRYAPRRRLNAALTHPPPDLVRVDAVGHGNACDRGAWFAARLNHRLLECLRMMPPAPTRLLDFHRKCPPSLLRGHDLRGLTR